MPRRSGGDASAVQRRGSGRRPGGRPQPPGGERRRDQRERHRRAPRCGCLGWAGGIFPARQSPWSGARQVRSRLARVPFARHPQGLALTGSAVRLGSLRLAGNMPCTLRVALPSGGVCGGSAPAFLSNAWQPSQQRGQSGGDASPAATLTGPLQAALTGSTATTTRARALPARRHGLPGASSLARGGAAARRRRRTSRRADTQPTAALPAARYRPSPARQRPTPRAPPREGAVPTLPPVRCSASSAAA